MGQLRGSLYMRAEALRAVVEACVVEGQREGMSEATASWVRDEVEAIALLAWDDGWDEGILAGTQTHNQPS